MDLSGYAACERSVAVRLLRLAGLVSILFGAVLQVVGCSSALPVASTPPASAGGGAETQSVRVAVVKKTNPGASAGYSGEVKSKTQVNVAAKLMGRVEQMYVDVGSEVKAGDPIASLERGTIEAQLHQAEAALILAQARLAQVESGPRTETVAQAEANLKAAEARLSQVKAGPTEQQLQIAETQVRVAKNQLFAVQSQADAYLGSPVPTLYTQEMKEAQSGVAWEQIQLAEAQLAQLRAGATPEQIAQAQFAVDAAKAQLDLAKAPFTEHDVAVVRAQVIQAQAAVDLVKTQLADTTVVSPIDGIVSERYLSVGALTAPGTPILSVVSGELEVSIAIEESRSSQVRVGQRVSVRVGAYPGKEFAGVVSSVAPTVDPRTRMISAKISIEDPEQQLKAGMFAEVTLAENGTQSVLSVSPRAIVEREGRSVVFLVADGRVSVRAVKTGASNDQEVQILDGLSGGEAVVLDPPVEMKEGDAVTAVRVEQ